LVRLLGAGFIGLLLPTGGWSAESGSEDSIEEVTEITELSTDSLWNPEMFPVIDRAVNLPTTHATRRHALLFSIDHRPQQRLADQTFRDWFGFDAGSLKIGFGLRFGILEGLDVGVQRVNGTAEIFDVYQADARYQLLDQDAAFLNLAGRVGVTWFYQPGVADAAGFLGQLLLDRTFAGRYTIGAGLLFHSDSSGAWKSTGDPDPSLAVAAWAEIRILSFLAWDLEVVQAVAGYAERFPTLSTAVKLITHRHTFSLLLTNNPYLSADGVVANTDRKLEDLILGFSITRELDF
jgi:hypothetical protein